MTDREFLRESLAHSGIARVILRYAYRAVRRVVDLDIYRVIYMPHDAVSADDALPRQFTWGRVAEEALLSAAADPLSGLQADDVRACLARGEECHGVWSDRRLLSYIWVAPNGAHVCQGICIRFDPQYALSRWAFTVESHRGQRLHVLVKQRALRSLALAGKRGMLSTVDVGNLASLAAAEHAGCRRIGWILVARLFGHRIAWASAGCRRFHIALCEAPGEPA